MNNKYDLMATQRTILNDPDLTPAQKGFLWTCTLRADNKTGKVRDSQENLAHYSRVNFKTVSNWINNFPAVNKYFRTKKRGRMLDLWFINVNLEVSLYDTRPSKIRGELEDTPSEMEYSEETDNNTPSEMEEQSVTEELQSDTPSEIPDTPSEIPDTPSEMEPSTCSSTLSSTDNAPQAAPDSFIFNNKEESPISPLVVIDEPSFALEDSEPVFGVVKNDAADDVENGPAEEEIDWEDFDAFADYEPIKEEVPMKSQTESLTFGEWFDSLQEGTVKDVAAFGIIHRKFHGQEKIKAVAIKSVDSEFDWCGDNPVMRYTYAALELQDMPDSGGRAANDTDQDEW